MIPPDGPFDPDHDPRRAVLAAVQTAGVSDEEMAESMAELGRLAHTLGLTVMDSITQRRDSFHAGTYLGSGKVADLKTAVTVHKAGLVLLDHELSPSQARNLEKETGAEVMDRTAVILEIFHRHARSRA